jgi:hypothetical protein
MGVSYLERRQIKIYNLVSLEKTISNGHENSFLTFGLAEEKIDVR